MAEIGTVLSICLNFSAEKMQKSEIFCPLLKTLPEAPVGRYRAIVIADRRSAVIFWPFSHFLVYKIEEKKL